MLLQVETRVDAGAEAGAGGGGDGMVHSKVSAHSFQGLFAFTLRPAKTAQNTIPMNKRNEAKAKNAPQLDQ